MARQRDGALDRQSAAGGDDPERIAEIAERREKLARYLTCLPPQEAEAVRCIDLLGLTIEEAAEALARPRATVAKQHQRAREKLEELVRASERETALGARRRPVGAP